MNLLSKIFRTVYKYPLDQALMVLKVVLALLLIGCLFNVSRDYYRVVRLIVFVMAVWITYIEYYKGVYVASAICLITAIMFNPVAPIFIPQYQWLLFYAALAIGCIGWVVYEMFLMEAPKREQVRYRDRS
jgi:hypothetical protein